MFKRLAIKDKHTRCNRCNYMGCSWSMDKYGSLRHWLWTIRFYKGKLSLIKAYRRVVNYLTRLDYSRIEDVLVDGIDTGDYPDFCDAFIAAATYKGRDMTEAELERLNGDSEYVYTRVMDKLY